MSGFTRQHEYLVGIDSDGCVFDTMELKHKECFIPELIQRYGLQGVSKYAREAAEFVNLYSKSRGVNRFPALVEELDWLRRRPEVRARRVGIPRTNGLREWIRGETRLGNPALEKAVDASGDPDLQLALTWSQSVNRSIAGMVHGVPPFPGVRESLERFAGVADMLVVSATPNEALTSEWTEHDLTRFMAAICGQESGSKRETLAAASQYDKARTLMIGDAPGDYRAAQANRCLFFPINPGAEEASWQRLLEEGIDRFLGGTFTDAYQRELLDAFDRCLPEDPPWPVVD
ncbi:MAG: HAD family hydrolase [Pirellulales bacterium]